LEDSENKSIISTGSSNLAKTEKLLSITQKILSEIKPKYESVRIGNQEWMTRNLDVDRFRNGDLIPHIESDKEWEEAGKNGQPAWCYYDNDPENGKKYGKLYNWHAVNDSRGLAPEGYHIPTDEEWSILEEFLGGKIAGGSMKSIEDWGKWSDEFGRPRNGNGSNSSSFNGLPGGSRGSDGKFYNIKNEAFFWSASSKNDSIAFYRNLFFKTDILFSTNFKNFLKSGGSSVRCCKVDIVTNFKINGEIGNQKWMTRNLDVDCFRNGDLIPHIESDEEWKKAGENGQPAWCYFNNDSKNGKKYGKLYNWFAVNDPRELTPEGWKVPTDDEWDILEEFLGGKDFASYKLKSVEGWDDWKDKNGKIQNTNGNNLSGFNALPGGLRKDDGSFEGINLNAIFWGIKYRFIKEDSVYPFNFYLTDTDNDIYRLIIDQQYPVNKSSGLSLRCIAKPKFESLKIGNQEWMTKNLDVDCFRNGDLIPYRGSKEDWEEAALNGQPGWCYYGDGYDYGCRNIKNGMIYGKLYNWFAVNDLRGLAPKGWHVPTDKELSELEAYLGEDSAGFKLKSKEKWGHSEDDNGNIQNGNGDNSSGLNCLPSGYRGKIRYFDKGNFFNVCEYFYEINYCAYFWSATERDNYNAFYRELNSFSNTLKRESASKSFGATIRLIRD